VRKGAIAVLLAMGDLSLGEGRSLFPLLDGAIFLEKRNCPCFPGLCDFFREVRSSFPFLDWAIGFCGKERSLTI